MPSKGQRKGDDFERRTARVMGPILGMELERVKDGEDSDPVKFPGDIKRVDGGRMPIVIECKCRAFSLRDCANDNANIRGWCEEAKADAKAAGIPRWCVAVPLWGRVALVTDQADGELWIRISIAACKGCHADAALHAPRYAVIILAKEEKA